MRLEGRDVALGLGGRWPSGTREGRAALARAILLGCAGAGLTGFLFRDFASWLWWNLAAGSLEAHCAAVPLMAAGLVWMRWADRSTAGLAPARMGLVLSAWALVLGLLATGADSLAASGLSLVLLVHGAVLTVAGTTVTSGLLGPIYFLLFMLPVRYPIEVFLGFPLRLLSSALAAGVLELAGLPVTRSGTVLTVPGFTVQVGAPCSGLNILTALLMIAAFMAVARRLNVVAASALIAASLPAAMAANALRIAAVAGIGSGLGEEAAAGFLHGGSGLAAFALAVGLIVAFGRLVERVGATGGKATPIVERRAALSPVAAGVRLVLLLTIAALADTTLAAHRPPPPIPDLAGFPRGIGSTSGRDEALLDTEKALQAATGGQIARRELRTGEGRVAWLALVTAGASWRVHHPPEFCYMAQGWTILENGDREGPDGGRFRELLAEKDGERRVVQYWFTDGRRSTSSLLARWFAALEAGFRGDVSHPWLLVAISTLDRETEALDEIRPALRRVSEDWLSGTAR